MTGDRLLKSWKKLPIQAKLTVVGQVIGQSELISATSADPDRVEARTDLEELAVKLLHDIIEDIQDPRRYR